MWRPESRLAANFRVFWDSRCFEIDDAEVGTRLLDLSLESPPRRIIITPLHWAWGLRAFLPFRLGFGFEVRDVSADVANVNLDVWKRFVSDDERESVQKWSVCLVNSYRESVRGDIERLIETLMHYVVAHLRLIVPNPTNADRFLRADVTTHGLRPLTITSHTETLHLEECEQLCAELKLEHLQKLKAWMPWIVSFRRRWSAFYPLFLSLYFAEMARREDDARVRHVLRVMALEALVSTDKNYGYKAIGPKLPKLLGSQTDIYAQYRNSDQALLPPLVLSTVLRDVRQLRNKIAHGDAIPTEWLDRNRRRTTSDTNLNYCEELAEASTGILSLAWRTIIDAGLQTHFGTKDKMEAYFRSI